MLIIVAGYLIVKPGSRDQFIEGSRQTVILARQNDDCEDFSVSPDPINSNRVNILERWTSRASLDTFRKSDPQSEVLSLVETFEVNDYEVKS